MVVVISVVLFLMVMTFLFITSFSDPGIIPKSNDDERNQIEKLCITEEARFGNHDFQPRLGHPPSPRIININGVEVKLKYRVFFLTCRIQEQKFQFGVNEFIKRRHFKSFCIHTNKISGHLLPFFFPVYDTLANSPALLYL